MAIQDAGLAVGAERELADLHLESLRPRLRFGQSDAADAGLREGHTWDSILVDRRRGLAGHVSDRDHAFSCRDMRELRRSSHDVADGVDAGFAGLLIFVDFDEAAVELDLSALESDVLGEGFAAYGDEQ